MPKCFIPAVDHPSNPPRIYLTGLSNGQDFVVDETAEDWLRDAVPLPTQPVAPYDLVGRFQSKVQGLVVWDPRLPVDTQNVATTMAGLNDWLPVSPTLATDLSARYGFPVAFDLRSLAFQTRAQAYDWALAHLPLDRITHLAWLGDTILEPSWLPLANVVSIGDLLLSTGLAWWAFRVTTASHPGSARSRQRRAGPDAARSASN